MGHSKVVHPHETLDRARLAAWAGERKDAFSAKLLEAVDACRLFYTDDCLVSHANIRELRASGAVLDGIEMQYSARMIDFLRQADETDEVSFEEACLLGEVRAMIPRLRDRTENMLHLLEAHPSHPTILKWISQGWAQRLSVALSELSEIVK